MTERGGYFKNSVQSWRARLNREHRLLATRLTTLRGMNHPCADDQAALMEINREMLEVLERGAIGEAAPAPKEV